MLAIVLPYLRPPHDPLEDHPDALNEYKIGQRMLGERQEAQAVLAIGHFQRAIDLVQSSSALAYTGLADAYNLQIDYGWQWPDVTIPKATDAGDECTSDQ